MVSIDLPLASPPACHKSTTSPTRDVDGIVKLVNDDGMTVVSSVSTHFHWDHIGAKQKDVGMGPMRIPGVFELASAGVPCHIPSWELAAAAVQTGLQEQDLTPISDNQCIRVGRFELEFLHTPGHSSGSMCIRVTGKANESESKQAVDLLITGRCNF